MFTNARKSTSTVAIVNSHRDYFRLYRSGFRGEDARMDERELTDDPLDLLRAWLDAARVALPDTFDAMGLATVGPDGSPAVRIVLLKDVSGKGLVFFTNYHSRKAAELDVAGCCAIVLHWPSLARQVRAEGAVSRVTDAESDAYFETRDRGSQIGAWASGQSQVLRSRAELEAQVAACRARFGDGLVPRPPHWGGYRIRPNVVEFWQASENRLHDRFRYQRQGDAWRVERLAP